MSKEESLVKQKQKKKPVVKQKHNTINFPFTKLIFARIFHAARNIYTQLISVLVE